MTAWLRGQRGNAMAISIMVVLAMTMLAIGTYSYVQGQQRQSADERVKDSAYNLAEAALESAVAYLGSGSVWTTMNGTTPWPYGAAQGQSTAGNCSQSSLATDNCPDPSTVTNSFNASNQQDYAGAPTWVTTVRDNSQPTTACTPLGLAGSCFYRESITNASSVPEYDSNGDGAVWVRAKATVQGRTRILVALVKPQPVPIAYPRQAFAGGYLTISSTLNQKVIDTQGSAASPGLIRLSCYFPTSPGPNNGGCPTADPNKGQIQPWTLQTGVLLNDCINNIGTVITGISCVSKDVKTDLANLKTKAQAAGTYYTACPSPASKWSGKLVYLEGPSLGCTVPAGTYNSAASPGMIVLGRAFGGNGTCSALTCLTLSGATTYYGLIYDSDNADTGDVFRVGISGTAKVVGAVISDWQGGLYIDSTSIPALSYDPNAFSALTTNGAPKIVQGTFREVPPGS